MRTKDILKNRTDPRNKYASFRERVNARQTTHAGHAGWQLTRLVGYHFDVTSAGPWDRSTDSTAV